MKLLFLCTHNRCRSILAEAVTRQIGGRLIEARSAGSEPAGAVHPLTLAYLEAGGYVTEGLHSKALADIVDFKPDVLITLCDSAAGESCPLWLNDTPKVHWGLPDPSKVQGEAEQQQAFQHTIDTLKQRIRTLKFWLGTELSETQIIQQLNSMGAFVR